MRVLFAGIIARYPFGGVTWCSLMYLLGLRALGHEVFYIEDTGECVYDPVQNKISLDPEYGTTYINDALSPFGLGDRWSFVNYDGSYHGAPVETVREYAAGADLYINLSGGSWFWRDEYARIPRKVFIDSDPAFTQLAIAKAEPWYVNFFRQFDHLFTFGANIGTAASPVPVGEFSWHKTWQPVTLGDWPTGLPWRDRFTTVMTWQIESFTDVGGNKDQEFVKYIHLPARTSQPFELAIKSNASSHGMSTRLVVTVPWTRGSMNTLMPPSFASAVSTARRSEPSKSRLTGVPVNCRRAGSCPTAGAPCAAGGTGAAACAAAKAGVEVP